MLVAHRDANKTAGESLADAQMDIVYPWVDGNDPKWRKKYEDTLNRAPPGEYGQDAISDRRFVQIDELKYSLRSIEIYAPFIRKIFIVTDEQTPSWLDTTHNQIEIVDHRTIFTNNSYLPTFNSNSIEAHFHRIPGLTENFLWANDDFFFADLCSVSDFIHPDGRLRTRMSPNQIVRSSNREDVFGNSWANTCDSLARELGGFYRSRTRHNGRNFFKKIAARIPRRGIWTTPAHVMQVQNKLVMEEACSIFLDEFAATLRRPFRHVESCALGGFSLYLALSNGIAHPEIARDTCYIQRGMKLNMIAKESKRLFHAKREGIKLFCLNDVSTTSLFDWQHEMTSLLQSLFPNPSRFEKK